MARLIQKSGYIKAGKAAGYMEYVATRDGVEIIQSTEPVTRKQERFIKRLLKDFPDAKELFEYSDYMQTPNRGTASAFIATVLDTHLHEVESESGYMSYIAQRPRAEKHGGHGLFSAAPVTDLNKAVAELDAHTGRVWTFIFSLRRKDAVQTGYNNAEAWRTLLLQQSNLVAQALRIPPDKLRWYAAFHDEGHHPHVHMMVWSADPKVGFLTKKGIFAMRSKFTGTIFQEELKDVYIRKEAVYKRSIQMAQDKLLELTYQMEQQVCPDAEIERWMRELSRQLAETPGKHVYGYLPKPTKELVEQIVERLAQIPEVAACYDQWWRLKDEIAGYYGRNTPPHLPLVQQKEFRTIKNMIIQQAETFRQPVPEQASLETEPVEQQVPWSSESPVVMPQPQTVTSQIKIEGGAVIQLLHHMSRVFRGNMPVIPPALRTDSKRRRRLQEKRMAMGHKRDDHEEQECLRNEQMIP